MKKNKQDLIFCVYALLDETGTPFYVGRTGNLKQRLYHHLREMNKGKASYTYNKMRKLYETKDYTLQHRVIAALLNFDDSVANEIATIASYKEAGIKLTNQTAGGEGLYGVERAFTDEWRANLSKAFQKNIADGYEQATKGKTYEELHGEEKAADIKKKMGEKISAGIREGRIRTNKGKNLEEIVGDERAAKIKATISATAKKTFTGRSQTTEQVAKRMTAQRATKANWTDEQRETIRKKYSEAQVKLAVRYNIECLFPTGEKVLFADVTYKDVANLMLTQYGIKCDQGWVSYLIHGRRDWTKTRHKCQFKKVEPL